MQMGPSPSNSILCFDALTSCSRNNGQACLGLSRNLLSKIKLSWKSYSPVPTVSPDGGMSFGSTAALASYIFSKIKFLVK